MNMNKMDTNSDSDNSLEHSTEDNCVDPQEPDKLLSTISPHSNKGTTQSKLCLFTAVEEDDIEMLDKLLLRSDVNLNEQDDYGKTALIMSIRLKRSFAFIGRLIESSCDVNISNAKGQTALHVAIIEDAIDVAYQLIGAGADLNAYDAEKGTPLYYAVFDNNLECVCMLLSCGADVRLPSKYNQTPLILAFLRKNVEIIKTLLYFYYEFSNACLNDVVIHLPDVPLKFEDILLLVFALFNGCVEAFRLIWSRFDHATLTGYRALLFEYVNNCVFPASDWLDCLYLVLESPYAFVLLEQYSRLVGHYFLIDAFDTLSEKNAKCENRTALIYMCLSVGMRVRFCDIEWIYKRVGFSEELEALIYAGNYAWADRPLEHYFFLHFILSLQEDCSTEKIFNYLCKQVSYTSDPNDIIQWIKFFSLRPHMISELCNTYFWCSSEEESQASALLCHATEFPSLLELSRNQVQKCIRRTHKITKPYQFHDVVKGLPLPKMLKDVVLFKRPIYK